MNQAFQKGFKAGQNTVAHAANPYLPGTDLFFDWSQGHWEGNQIRGTIMAHEHKLYRSADPARFEMLWG